MISIYDVLKASKGIHVDDTFANLWGRKLSNAYTVATYTGTLPATLRTVRGYLVSYKIYGNAIQAGTPTPENPIMPSGCGVRTENVMPAGERKTVVFNGVTFSSDGNGRYHISGTATEFANVKFNLLSGFTAPISVSNGGQGTLSFFNTQSNNKVTLRFYNGTILIDSWNQTSIRRTATAYSTLGNKYTDNVVITVSSGATVDMTIMPEFTDDGILPSEFEPYGYKLPLTLGSTTTDIYLGEAQSTRRIKKLVLTGEENWSLENSDNFYTHSVIAGAMVGTTVVCSHQASISNVYVAGAENAWISMTGRLNFTTTAISHTVSDFKAFLAQQYANGTPVTVWYVLEEPETGIVNEPLMKIGDYADTVSMEQAGVSIPTAPGETTISWAGEGLAPSEVELTYRKPKGQ